MFGWASAASQGLEQRKPPHVYSEPLTAEVWAYGEDTCIYCGRVDPKRTKYTNPPCPRLHA